MGRKVWRKYASDKQTQQQHFYSPVYAKKREKKQKSKELENIEKRGTIRRRRRLRRKKQEKQPSGEQEVGPSRKGLKEGFPRVWITCELAQREPKQWKLNTLVSEID